MEQTPIQYLGKIGDNELYIKRDDLLPFSFGGNKARKADLFFREIDAADYDCVVTYGSSSSNHCRVVANQCAKRGMPCYIIGPEESSEQTFNSCMMTMLGAEITVVPVDQVHETIERKLADLRNSRRNPYFIPGGGHGNIGTQAYVNCYHEIQQYESEQGLHFDYIFHASGTGTTQAGLICGQLLTGEDRKIIGISIARKNPRGRDVVLQSVQDYLNSCADLTDIQAATVFLDEYTGDGYGKQNKAIADTIEWVMVHYGIPMDATYTGKAFLGMEKYIKKEDIKDKNILFIHTGGTPLFFDDLMRAKL